MFVDFHIVHKIKTFMKMSTLYLLHSPTKRTAMRFFVRQACLFSVHSLSYVTSSVPQTGRRTLSQGSGQVHPGVPSRLTRHSSPCSHVTRWHGLLPGEVGKVMLQQGC